MKTKDFETAIAALNVGIVIDEMKLGSVVKPSCIPSPLMHIIS